MDMLKEERQQLIIEMLRQDGKVMASQLSSRFGVSEDTIRRDLRDLTQAGKMLRVHGGALPHSPAEAPYRERLKLAPHAKMAIARTALSLLRQGQVVLMDGGTTNLQVAQMIPQSMHLTVITNNVPVINTLSDHPSIEVVVIGGRLFKGSLTMIGGMAVQAVQTIHADLFLLGVCSLHPEVGISVVDLEESYLKREMINCSTNVAALATADKIGTASPYVVAPISALTYLITESEVPAELLAVYHSSGVEIIQSPDV